MIDRTEIINSATSEVIVHPPGPEIAYIDYPKYYLWEKGKWKRRANGKKAAKMIGRIHAADPKQGDRWWIRLLLETRSEGATCFRDLCLPGHSFHSTCVELGLTHDPKGNTYVSIFTFFVKNGKNA